MHNKKKALLPQVAHAAFPSLSRSFHERRCLHKHTCRWRAICGYLPVAAWAQCGCAGESARPRSRAADRAEPHAVLCILCLRLGPPEPLAFHHVLSCRPRIVRALVRRPAARLVALRPVGCPVAPRTFTRCNASHPPRPPRACVADTRLGSRFSRAAANLPSPLYCCSVLEVFLAVFWAVDTA